VNLFLSHFFGSKVIQVIQVTMPTVPPAHAPAGRGALVVAPGTRGTGGGRRRGGGGAPTTNPRTITDFEEITAIPFVFVRHPPYTEAHMHMNSIYSDAFLDMANLFVVTDPPTRATLVADPVAIIKAKIRDESIIPNAIDTTDATAIAPLWARCFFLDLRW